MSPFRAGFFLGYMIGYVIAIFVTRIAGALYDKFAPKDDDNSNT